MPRLDFDVNAKDDASATLGRIGAAFRRLARDADEAGADSGRGYGAGLRRWFKNDGPRFFRAIGRETGGHIGGAIASSFIEPGYNLALFAALAAVMATVGPGVGAVLAGGVIAGAGAGLAGLGLVFAAKSEQVKNVWKAALERMAADMRVLSQPFEATLITMAAVAERTFSAFKPALGAAFQSMAPVVDRFVDQTGRALERLVPAIAPITAAFNAVLDAMGPALNSAIGSIASALTRLAESVRKNPEALAELVTGLGSLTSDALRLIGTLNEVNAQFSKLTGGISAVDATIGLLRAPLAIVNAAFEGQRAILAGLNFVMQQTTVGTNASGASMNAAADKVTKNAQALTKNSAAAKGLQGPLGAISDALSRQKAQFTSTIAAMGQWTSKALAASGAAIGYEAALDDATASLKENGRTLDISTAKGRANRTALNNLAEAANRQTEAMDAAGASNQTVARKAESARANFVRLARQMGLSKAQAEALARQLINIPNVSRTVTITRRNITYNDIITRKSTGNFEGGINARAEGGPVSPGPAYLVGERGPEVVEFDRPGRVIPNRALRSAFGGTAEPVVLKIEAGTSQLDQALLAILKKAIRVRGGNVQLVLGS